MTRTITDLEIALAEKEGYMALAHTRLGNRAQRPGMELCKDSVELALVNEVAELRKNCATMQHMLAEVRTLFLFLKILVIDTGLPFSNLSLISTIHVIHLSFTLCTLICIFTDLLSRCS